MHRGFGPAAFEPEQEHRDKELTVGPTMLIGIAIGLVGLCAICFVAGYAIGHRSPAEPFGVQPSGGGPSAAQILNSQPKPLATQDGFAAHSDAEPSAGPDAAAETAVNGVSTGASTTPPAVVQTSLPAQTIASQPTAAAVQAVEPALPQAGGWMVQIAAVSHSEDADVLVGALRKRGYTVSVRRDPADNLMHVQVGPFTSHADAASMRQRLLADGYNAIIQP